MLHILSKHYHICSLCIPGIIVHSCVVYKFYGCHGNMMHGYLAQMMCQFLDELIPKIHTQSNCVINITTNFLFSCQNVKFIYSTVTAWFIPSQCSPIPPPKLNLSFSMSNLWGRGHSYQSLSHGCGRLARLSQPSLKVVSHSETFFMRAFHLYMFLSLAGMFL